MAQDPEKFMAICAWCGRSEERQPPAAPLAPAWPITQPASPVSHVICDACFKRERAEVERIVRGRRRSSA